MKNTYYKILNEIASVFDVDQWDKQVNVFTDIINKQLKPFVHNTEYDCIFILENYFKHDFPQYKFYKERCYVNGEKVELDWGLTKNKWENQKTVDVIIEDLDQLGESCNSMFYNCSSLVSVPWFDTSRVSDMSHMFQGCQDLELVPLFNITNVTNMYIMFDGCKSLSEKTKQEWSSVYNFETDEMK